MEQFQGKKFLITGAGGLIGTNIIYRLAEMEREYASGMEIYAVCRRRRKAEARFAELLPQSFFHLLCQDICEPLELEESCDYIIHAAGNAHPRAYMENPAGTIETAVCGTDNILKYMRSHSPDARLLFLSSFEVYSVISAGRVPDGRDAHDARASYPLGKMAAENLCVGYRKQFGTDIVILRPAYVYGPYFDEESSKADAEFFRAALAGKDITLHSAGQQRRSYCYAGDMAEAVFTVLQRGVSGEAYDVAADGSDCSLYTFAKMIAERAHTGFTCLNDEEADGNMPDAVLNADKLKKLGWRAKYTLEAGMDETLEKMKAQMRQA